jgi:sugar lactone lactonase YvrE
MLCKSAAKRLFDLSMREIRLKRVAFGLVLVAGLALSAWVGYDEIKSIPPLRQAYYWVFNLRYPPSDLDELGDGGLKELVLFGDPVGIAEDEFGNIYVSDRGRSGRGRVIWKLDNKGYARIIAGTGRRGGAPANMPARASDLGTPEGLCVDNAGRVYFADAYNHVVLRIELDGSLTRVAGTGRPGYNGDGMPATESLLYHPYDVDIDSQGNLYIADTDNHRIRKVTPSGTIYTVAGTGDSGYDAGGGPATDASLDRPFGLAVDGEDRLYIADSENHVIRRVDHDGTISTVAGVGDPGYAGDGGPARLALLDTPQDIAFDQRGRLLVNDEHNHALRIVEQDGRISTLAGTGAPGFTADEERAASAQLNDPEHLLVRSDGSLLITEGDNFRVLIIRPDGRVWSFAGRGSLEQAGEN